MVRPKKHLGQHFLKDKSVATRLAQSIDKELSDRILEIGPGTGVLTEELVALDKDLWLCELDMESIEYLRAHFPMLSHKLIYGDFLKLPILNYIEAPFSLVGNFPYNISSQIVFKMLDHRNDIPEMVGMFQKEVADRIVSIHGNKVYGILSVLVQAYYEAEYLFTVEPDVFYPPPKVRSAVIRLKRRTEGDPQCSYSYLKAFVKTAFNQRRKTLRNALKSLNFERSLIPEEIWGLRAEQLSVEDFVRLAERTAPDAEGTH
jgi:16S rRNA (adenine1518-N6/adenine1519-N6)-dimethyltransferase